MQNFYTTIDKKYIPQKTNYANYDKVQIALPFRALLVGSSGSGKTNTLLNLIKEINAWDKIFLFAKDLEEPLYQWFIDSIKEVEKKTKSKILFASSDLKDVPSVDDIDKRYNNLVIWDDMINEKDQSIIEEYYIRARKKNCSLIYLTQSYYSTPSKIRKNCNLVFITKLATMNDLSRIISEYKLEITKEELLKKYNEARSNFGNFLLIDLNSNEPHLQYRINFGEPVLKQTPDQKIKILKNGKDILNELNLVSSEIAAGNDSLALKQKCSQLCDECLRRGLISPTLAHAIQNSLW